MPLAQDWLLEETTHKFSKYPPYSGKIVALQIISFMWLKIISMGHFCAFFLNV
jgi:hypothetical protein